VWIDPFKVGKTAGLQKISEYIHGKGNENEGEERERDTERKRGEKLKRAIRSQDISEADQVSLSLFNLLPSYPNIYCFVQAMKGRKWMKYMLLDPVDGVTDPPG
jgi:hypothetical protein